ncbi:MAG TPA: aspartate/glutamate racemase family protein [Acetobacteraceae bacterium]|jgi:allantoin racemase|nr:aspartate/glutamate racemase family protein [Acetobacteraceae bacterium]
MARILLINPNRSSNCTAGINAAVAGFRRVGGPAIDVVDLPDGPPAIYTWRDWHAVVEPLCRRVERETADVYVIACASDPGIEAVRSVTPRPVLGVFRSAVAAAVARAERFGVIAIVDASKARHIAALRAMGLEARLAAEVALNVTMDALLEPETARVRLINAARACAAAGAGTVILGCTGMAHHRAIVEREAGVPVIEPCQAAAALALAMAPTGG